MNRTLLLAAFLLPIAGQADAAKTLDSLPVVKTALEQGRSVSVVLDLGLCQPASPTSKPTRTRGGRRIDAFRETEDGTLAFSDNHFTISRDGRPIQQFLRYSVHPNGDADFSMTTLNMPDFQKVGETVEYRCAINKGMRFVASDR